jgi:pyruvate,water dikinase
MSTVPPSARVIVSLDDAADDTVDEVGLKGWYLSRLRDIGFDTPAGFVVTTAVYEDAIRSAHVDHRLHSIWAAARNASADEVAMLARKARHLISQIELPGSLVHTIGEALDALGTAPTGTSETTAPVAVRSSAAPGAVSGPDCAGVHASFTDVGDLAHVISRIHGCWASLFGERALAMRARGLGADDPTIAVVVQRMVAADKSGLAIPNGDSSKVLIEATFGLGEPIISGAVEPDRYVVDHLASSPTSVSIGHKRVILEGAGGAGHSFMPAELQHARVLSADEVALIARLSASVDDHFGAPHEVEWAVQNGNLHVLQVRPFNPGHDAAIPSFERTVDGIGVGVGFVTGRVRVIHRLEDLTSMSTGEILVTKYTGPEWTPHLERAAAVITDDGDGSCHAARVAREVGIPAVVGTRVATTTLDDGLFVTVDAGRGWVLPAVASDDS